MSLPQVISTCHFRKSFPYAIPTWPFYMILAYVISTVTTHGIFICDLNI